MSELPLEISCAETKAKLDAGEDLLLLDCREHEEFDLVSIKGATLLPMSELVTRAGELDQHRERPIVVHCHHGGRSAQVTNWLRQRGFASVQNMTGGIDQWAVEIDPKLRRY